MATQLQIRRGTAAQVAAFTGAEGEIVYNSTNDSIHTNDGATAGGFELARIDGSNFASTVTFSAITAASMNITSNIVIGGTVDGRDIATDGTKLDGIETGATTDQTAAQIKTSYESNLDTNAFTDAFSTKLTGIEAGATADQTNAEIRAAVAAATNSNVFTDAFSTKLTAIEALADVTDTTNVTAAGAVMDGELADIAAVKALDQGVATTDSPTFSNLTMTGTGSVKVPAGTTGERDGTPANGMFRYNSTNEQFEGYQNSEWGSIGGGGGSNTFTTDTFTGDGTTTAYDLSQVISSEDNLMVFIAGVFQQQSAYSIATASGTTTLTFSTAPVNTREIVIYSIAGAVSGTNLNVDSMTGDGSDVTMTLSITPVNENNTQVFIDGVYQSKSNYSISGTTLTFSTAPPTGTAVEVMTMNQTDINVPVDGTVTSAKLDTNIAIAGTLGVGGAATVDGNLLVGKTAINQGATGTELRADGTSIFTKDGGGVAVFNRLTDDGAIVNFKKDTTTVGSIGTGSGLLTIGTGTGNLLFENALVAPCSTSALGASNGVVDLGASTRRFKNLHLSGGVVFGTTGGAVTSKTLDDYEEGNWTPAISGGSQTITAVYQARYTKIGRSVTLNVYCTQSTVTDATSLVLTGLPFIASHYNATGILNFATNSSGGPILCRTVPSDTKLFFYRCDADQVTVTQTQNAGHIIFSITYITDQ